MVDTVTTQVLENGSQWFRAKFTSLSDGTGETNVTKIDPTSAATGANNMGVTIQGQKLYPGTHLKVMGVTYSVTNMTVEMQWVATTNVDLWLLNSTQVFDFQDRGGLYMPPALVGGTGAISFTTKGAASGSSYSIEVWCKKDIVQ